MASARPWDEGKVVLVVVVVVRGGRTIGGHCEWDEMNVEWMKKKVIVVVEVLLE